MMISSKNGKVMISSSFFFCTTSQILSYRSSFPWMAYVSYIHILFHMFISLLLSSALAMMWMTLILLSSVSSSFFWLLSVSLSLFHFISFLHYCVCVPSVCVFLPFFFLLLVSCFFFVCFTVATLWFCSFVCLLVSSAILWTVELLLF